VAATAALVGITVMRKMGARINDSKLRVRATWYQSGLLVLEACVAILVFAYPGVMALEILELCVCAALLLNLLYFFRTYRNGVNKTFDAYTVRSVRQSESDQGNDSASARSATLHVNQELQNAKRKLQTSMTLGIFVLIGIMLVCFSLMNPIWRRRGGEADPAHAAGTCVLRGNGSAMTAIDWTKSGMFVAGSIAAHVTWWHTLLIFRASKKQKRAASSAKTSKKKKRPPVEATTNSGGTGGGSGSGRGSGSGGSSEVAPALTGMSEIERSTVQGG
jgi:hypothetical protein